MKKLCILGFILISLLCLYGHSEDFVIGNYSYLKYDHGFFNQMVQKMEDSHYNATIWEPSDEYNMGTTNNQIALLESSGIDSYLYDHITEFDNSGVITAISLHNLSLGNYWKFEAEFDNNSENIHTNENFYFYKFSINRPGNSNYLSETNDSWLCNPLNHTPGEIIDTLYNRWPSYYNGDNGESMDYHNVIGPEFEFAHESRYNNYNYLQGNKLYINFVYRLGENLNDSNCMKFGFRLYDTEADSVWSFVDLRNVKGPLVTNKLFTYTANQLANDDYSTPINEDYPNQFRQVTFYIDLAELYATGYYFNDNDELDERSPFNESYGNVSFRGIMPYVYWSGNHQIELDYIEIEDEIHRIVTDPVRTDSLVRNRLDDYSNIPSSAKFYTRDEPSFAHFDSYKRLQDIFGESSDISQNLITTINATKLDKKKYQSDKRYSHFTLFEDYTDAKELMIDFYPLRPEANWNNPYYNDLNSDSNDGVQFLIDWIVSANYRRAKIVAREKPFYVVPCTAGRWNRYSDCWDYYQYPTTNMMKCLQYLPLCYGVDGVIDFKLYSSALSDTTDVKYRWYALLDSDSSEPVPPQYEAIKQANAKLAIYGPILQDLEWIDATTISTGGLDIFDSNMYSTDEAFALGSDPYFSDTEIYIDPLNDNNYDLYNGYVHIGFFQDDENYPTYMLVNRRTDYVNGDATSMKDIDPETMMSEYNEQNSFREASSQFVEFDLDQNIIDEFGEYVSLFDPASKHSYYKNEDSEICVEIDPGEGIMLELASTLPNIITENLY